MESEIEGDQAQPQPQLIGPEAMTAKPSQLHRLLGFLDPLVRGSGVVQLGCLMHSRVDGPS